MDTAPESHLTSASDLPKTYSGDEGGVREAVRDYHKAAGPDPTAPRINAPRDLAVEKAGLQAGGVTAQTATKALSAWRERQAKERAELDAALGVPEATAGAAETDTAASVAESDSVVDEAAKAETERQQREAASRNERQAGERFAEMQRMRAVHEQVTAEFQSRFPEIGDLAQLQALATIDPQRYSEAVALVNNARIAVSHYQALDAQARDEATNQFNAWGDAQDRKLVERNPELARPEIGEKVRKIAHDYAKSLGFTDDELGAAWSGAPISLRDARIQEVFLNAARYSAAKAAKPSPKPVPPVQRPGVSRSLPERKAEAAEADIGRARGSLRESGKINDALALLRAQRAARG